MIGTSDSFKNPEFFKFFPQKEFVSLFLMLNNVNVFASSISTVKTKQRIQTAIK